MEKTKIKNMTDFFNCKCHTKTEDASPIDIGLEQQHLRHFHGSGNTGKLKLMCFVENSRSLQAIEWNDNVSVTINRMSKARGSRPVINDNTIISSTSRKVAHGPGHFTN